MKHVIQISLYSLAVLTLFSCNKKTETKTIVNPDGSLQRSITLINADSSSINKNSFGINESLGWLVEIKNSERPDKASKHKSDITFKRHFSSVEEANQVAQISDTIHQIHSSFKKEFKWFYTYIYYSDTYSEINRFKHTSIDDYLTKEDYQFINRLPAESEKITTSDSLFLKKLNEKIYDDYVSRAVFDEYIEIIKSLLEQNNLGSKWLQKLNHRKEALYQQILTDKSMNITEYEIGEIMIDSLQIPMNTEKIKNDYKVLDHEFKSRLEYMSDAVEAKLSHEIQMPWTVVDTNADSVANNQLFWKPATVKLLAREYKMYATARKINIWTFVLTGVLFIATLIILFKSRS